VLGKGGRKLESDGQDRPQRMGSCTMYSHGGFPGPSPTKQGLLNRTLEAAIDLDTVVFSLRNQQTSTLSRSSLKDKKLGNI
jgi:hypothetical protein